MKTKHKQTYPLKIPTSEYPDFCDRLKVAMNLRNYTVSRLAKETYLTKSAICGYRNGSRTPNLVILKLIATSLDVSSDFLIGLKEYIYI